MSLTIAICIKLVSDLTTSELERRSGRNSSLINLREYYSHTFLSLPARDTFRARSPINQSKFDQYVYVCAPQIVHRQPGPALNLSPGAQTTERDSKVMPAIPRDFFNAADALPFFPRYMQSEI